MVSAAQTTEGTDGGFILRACKVRLSPDAQTNRYLFGFSDARRWVWNACVAWMEETALVAQSAGSTYAPHEAFSLSKLNELLHGWVGEEPWLRSVPKQVLQQVLMDFIKARKAFLSRSVSRPPRFQKATKAIPSMRFPQHARLNQDSVFLPKLGWVKYRNSFNKGRGVPAGELRSVTARFENGYWVASLLMRQPAPAKKTPPPSRIGIDYGVKNTLALSSREVLSAPLMSTEEGRFIHFLERRVARCEYNSVRRALAQRRLNRFRSRINRRIHDWRHKTTTYLAKNHGLIVAEGMAMKNMTATARGTVEAPGTNVRQKAGLNRSLLDPGFGIIMQQLAYKQAERGHGFIQVNPAHTSQTCPECGHVCSENRPSRDHFKCVACGHADEADFVAATNILARGSTEPLAAGLGRDCATTVKSVRGHRSPNPRTNPRSSLAA